MQSRNSSTPFVNSSGQEANSLSQLTGVGPKSINKLQKLGVNSVYDLFFHLPNRYEDRTKVKPIKQLFVGESAVVEGEIIDRQIKFGRRRSLLLQITDGSGFLRLRFFYFSKAQEKKFSEAARIQCFGEIRRGPEGLEIVHPEYLLPSEKQQTLTQDKLTPVYPISEGIQQKSLRNIISQAITSLADDTSPLIDLLPPTLLGTKLPSLKQAVFELHNPNPETDKKSFLNAKHPAQQRLILEELLAHHLSMRKLRNVAQSSPAPVFCEPSELVKQFRQQLPYALTDAQLRVIDEIAANVSQSTPMLRLLQGDVGSGKTVVAMAAALQAVESGFQVAFMAPTEMLAEQHLENIQSWAEKLNVKTGWLSGKVKTSYRSTTLDQLANGEIQILIGTHALFQKDVAYKKLGLVIVDEQHRFGVHQRLALKEKSAANQAPHQLIMTATPIPRTLAMTAYADLDLSIIDELPKGRQPIDTVVIPETRREQVIQRVEQACKSGRQAYWVCPLIEESEALNCQAAALTATNLQQALPQLKIGLVHGRMKTEQRNTVMNNFKLGEIDLLVATTVIEVGVDVPNASLMIIENAERLGLSQLHQLRGRVGRGNIKSSCVLLYKGKLSKVGKERLSIMRETNDGFAIAEKDLEIRGPGELLGTKQTGLLQLRIADVTRDQYLFPTVEKLAEKMITHYPENIQPLIDRWLSQGLQYGSV